MTAGERRQIIGSAVIPFGYELWADGVFAKKPGSELPNLPPGEGPKLSRRVPSERRSYMRRLAIRPIWISGVGGVRDVEPGPMSDPLVELSYHDVGGRLTTVWVARGAITSRGTLSELSGTGWLPVNSETAPDLIRYLERCEQAAGEQALVPVARRVGPYKIVDEMTGAIEWGWVWGSDWIGPGSGVHSDPRPGRSVHGTFAAVGSWESWRDVYAGIVADSSVGRFVVGASFASLLLRFLGGRTFVLHHWFESGAGKTAIAIFAQSVWGNTDAEPLKTTFNRTEKSISAIFAHVTDYPVLYDEKQVSTIRSSQFIYDVGGGIPRGRSDERGVSRTDQQNWTCLVRTTGETPLVESDDLGGQNNRVLQLHATVGIEEQRLSDLYGFVKKHHGHAGPRFLRKLAGIVNDPERLARMKAIHAAFETTISKRSGRTGNHVTYVATIALGQWLAEQWLLGLDAKMSRDRAIEDALAVLNENVPEHKQDYSEKALDRLRDHRISEAFAYIDGRTLSKDDLDAAISQSKHLVGIEMADEILYIPSEINRTLRKSFFSPEKTWRGFAERGWIRSHNRADRARGTYQSVQVWLLGKRVRVYALKASVLTDGQRGLDREHQRVKEQRETPELVAVGDD